MVKNPPTMQETQVQTLGHEGISAGGCGWDQSQGAARPGRPVEAQRTGGGEGGQAGPAKTPGLRKQPVGTSGAWPLQSPLYQEARTKEGSCLVPLFCRKKLGTETRAATLSHVGVLHLPAAHQPSPCLPRGSLGPEMALSISTPVLFRV